MSETIPVSIGRPWPVPARRGLLSIVIDPDNQRRAQIRGMLQKQVMVVCEAASLSEARHSITALGAPDLVICDIAMLRETIEGLNDGDQPEGGHVRAYRLAVIPDRCEALHALAEGADDFLVWPNPPEAIEGRLRAVVQQGTLHAWLDTLHRASMVVTGARRLDGLFAAVAARLRQILPVDHFIVARPEAEDIRFEVVDMVSPGSPPWTYCLRNPESETCSERFIAAPTGHRICDGVHDRDPRLAQGMRSCLCLPLLDNGRVIGSLSMASREPRAFDSGLTPHLGALAVQVGHAMANIQRYEHALSETERLATIVREVHHRIKNNLQGVVGLLAEHRDTTPALAAVLNSAISQLHAVAEVHNLLAHQNEEQISLTELVRAVVTHTATLCHHRLEVDFPENTDSFMLSAGEAVPFALVVNELVMNAIKHGYPDGGSGTIRISLDASGEASLRVANDGCLPEPMSSADRSGLGLQLVRALLPASCTLRLSGTDGWTVAEVTLRDWIKNS
jgi:two-component sensor histidine kinase